MKAKTLLGGIFFIASVLAQPLWGTEENSSIATGKQAFEKELSSPSPLQTLEHYRINAYPIHPIAQNIFEQQIEFRKGEDERQPVFSMKIFTNDTLESNYKATVVYFHGGPGLGFIIKGMEGFFSKLLQQGYRVVAVEIAGSQMVSSYIEDKVFMKEPNYVTQIGLILDYLNSKERDKKPFIGFSHSYGSFQLFNYLRYRGEKSGFSKIFSSSGAFNTGAWAFQMGCVGQRDSTDIWKIWENSFFGESSAIMEFKAKNEKHSFVNQSQYHNPLVDFPLDQILSPFFHPDKMPKIPYYFQVVTNDNQVHASQSIGFHEILKQEGLSSHLLVINKGDHELMNNPLGKSEDYQEAQGVLENRLINFLEDKLQAKDQDTEWALFSSPVRSLQEVIFYEPNKSGYYNDQNKYSYQDWNMVHEEIAKHLSPDTLLIGLEKSILQTHKNFLTTSEKLMDSIPLFLTFTQLLPIKEKLDLLCEKFTTSSGITTDELRAFEEFSKNLLEQTKQAIDARLTPEEAEIKDRKKDFEEALKKAQEALHQFNTNPESLERKHQTLTQLNNAIQYEEDDLEKIAKEEPEIANAATKTRNAEKHFLERVWLELFALTDEIKRDETLDQNGHWKKLNNPFESNRYERLKFFFSFSETLNNMLRLEEKFYEHFLKKDKLTLKEIDSGFHTFEKSRNQLKQDILSFSNQYPALNMLAKNLHNLIRKMEPSNRPKDLFNLLSAWVEIHNRTVSNSIMK